MMKYIFFFFIAFIALSCASHSTAPMMEPAHPFPQAFKQVAVSFRNLPEHWDYRNRTWDHSVDYDKTTIDSGTAQGFAGDWSFNFSDSTFSKSGDTLRAPGLTLVADQSSGILKFLKISYNTTNYEGEGSSSTSYWLSCYGIMYVPDSSNQIVILLSGQSLQTGLGSLSYGYYETTDPYHLEGNSTDNRDTYIDTVVSTSSLTIRFIK